MGRKHCGKGRNLLITSNFSFFPTAFSKDLHYRQKKQRLKVQLLSEVNDAGFKIQINTELQLGQTVQ